MATFPYTRYACPCDDTTSAAPTTLLNKRASQHIQVKAVAEDQEEDGDGNFNPHNPRANYSLYPLDQLLFCDECNHTRCSKCWSEETLYWYCPACLFEVPSSGVKSDGNR